MELGERSIPFFEERDDDEGLFQALWTVTGVEWTHGHAEATERYLIRLLELAQRMDSPRRVGMILHWWAGTLVWGQRPADEALRDIDDLMAKAEGQKFAIGSILTARAALVAMLGLEDEARATSSQAQAALADLGDSVLRTLALATRLGFAYEILGDPGEAERIMRPALEYLAAVGEKSFLSTAAPRLGRVLARIGRLDEAEELARTGRDEAPPDDWVSQVIWRQAMALVLAGRGRLDDAEALIREAVAMCSDVDFEHVASVWEDLASVLRLRREFDEARQAIERAIELYEAKRNLADAARARAEFAD
jgi:tetratricopeptide (TPR) repeat protein